MNKAISSVLKKRKGRRNGYKKARGESERKFKVKTNYYGTSLLMVYIIRRRPMSDAFASGLSLPQSLPEETGRMNLPKQFSD